MKTNFNSVHFLTATFIVAILVCINIEKPTPDLSKSEVAHDEDRMEGPMEFLKFHQAIRTMEGKSEPDYEPNYQWKELARAEQLAAAHKLEAARTEAGNGVIEWKERGPANVPGRTRGVIVDPDDPSHRTWYAGSATGGIWKTIDGGTSWQWLTPDISNLATSALAMAETNRNIIYAGSGEGFGLLGGVSGSGIFKSTDRGNTWTLLQNTAGFAEINRIIINPADENNVIVAANSGIYRTSDGGVSWTKTFTGLVQDIKAAPNNFSIQYAGQNRVGVIKSTNGGITWSLAKEGMNPNGRVEIAISPIKPDRIFASTQGALSGTNSDLYFSDDGAATWVLVDLKLVNKTLNYLGDQGWYDNTVACDPFDINRVYVGGIGAYRVQLNNGGTGSEVGSFALQQNGTTFLALIAATGFNNGTFDVKPDANNKSVEIRFGPGINQKAHRFLVPDGATSGVPDANYAFQDYVTVPFQVWDISTTPNRQLMVSFRDQDRNGAFNLLLSNTTGAATEQSREYIFIHNINYSESASSAVSVAGGQMIQQMYNFWPVLSAGSIWTPNTLPTSNLRIVYSSITKLTSTVVSMSDSYNEYDSKNNANVVHPDQHNLVIIKETGINFRILMANDGGLYLSNISANPGIEQGNWTKVGNGYNTSQFYGADKKPGADEYIGGMQDNATYYSAPGISADATTSYLTNNVLGGDGFEAIWNNLDGRKLIGGSQFNNFGRSIDGGVTWARATTGITSAGGNASHPFVSKLANSKESPDVIFTVSREGVYRSIDFGANWSLTPITEKWGLSSLLDVEVSRANANIVWAGNGMTANLNIHVSTDGGLTFKPTNNAYQGRGITKLASHPFEEKTAYALFSQARTPKVLRTTNLGQTWEDISGFDSGTTSTRGFPDVAVFCLYVRTDDPSIIWVGSEIGIVESLDGGLTWNLLDEFPNVSVWDMKGQDDQVVIATHGRGIWTAKVPSIQIARKNPIINAAGTSPQGRLSLKIKLEEEYDSTHVYVNNQKIGRLTKITPGEYIVKISGVGAGVAETKIISFVGSAPIQSAPLTIDHINVMPLTEQYFNYFSNPTDFSVTSMSIQSFGGSVNKTMQTTHPYQLNREYTTLLRQPIKITNTHPFFFYRDVAIVEPVKDFVVVEATKDGVNWTPIAPAYDATFNSAWTAAFTSFQNGTEAMFVDHTINLTTKFAVNDTLLFRFRMKSDNTITGWGWSIDDLYIQQKPTAVSEVAEPQVSIYPNPSSGSFSASIVLSSFSDVNFQLIDLSGRTLAQLQKKSQAPGLVTQEFTLNDSPAGIYLLKIVTRDGQWTKKVSVKR